MKNTIIGLLAATLIVAPAFASARTERFTQLDADNNGSITYQELTTNGCKLKYGIFTYVDEDRDGALSSREYGYNFELLKRCK